jgi:hypothetical protein
VSHKYSAAFDVSRKYSLAAHTAKEYACGFLHTPGIFNVILMGRVRIPLLWAIKIVIFL